MTTALGPGDASLAAGGLDSVRQQNPGESASSLQAATLAGIADLFAVVAGTPDDIPANPVTAS
jgi:hypothetical protein